MPVPSPDATRGGCERECDGGPRLGPGKQRRHPANTWDCAPDFLDRRVWTRSGTFYARASLPPVYLAAHALVAISLVGFSAYATVVAFRRQGAGLRAAALTTLVGALGATVGGAAFLTVGSPSGLDAMVVLGLVAVLGAVLLIAFGVV